MVKAIARHRSRHAALFLAALVLHGCSRTSDEPLTVTGTGLTALRWGMPPDSAIVCMEEMQGVTLVSDTLIVPRKVWAYHAPESVRVFTVGRYPVRVFRFEGGSFLGYPVSSWSLCFRDGVRLEQVDISAGPGGEYRQEFSSLTERLSGIYGQITARWQMSKEGTDARDAFRFGRRGQFVALGWVDSVARMDYLKATSIVEVITIERRDASDLSDISFSYYDRNLRDELDDLVYEDPAFFKPEVLHISEVDTGSMSPIQPPAD